MLQKGISTGWDFRKETNAMVTDGARKTQEDLFSSDRAGGLVAGFTAALFESGAGSPSKRTSRCGKGKDNPAAITASYTAEARLLLICVGEWDWSVHTLSSKSIELSPYRKK